MKLFGATLQMNPLQLPLWYYFCMMVLRAFTEFNKIKYDFSKLIFLLYDGFMHLQVDGLNYQALFGKMSPHSSPVWGGGDTPI